MSDDVTDERAVVTVFLRNKADVLLLRRSEGVGSYAGKWGAVAGHAEGAPDDLAREEIAEETGLLDATTLVRRGETFAVEDTDRGTRWLVHPYLFECSSRDVVPNYETTEWTWVSPIEILERDTVPALWRSYARIAPTVETVREDREHGSAYISYRALEVLRDRAAASAAGRTEPERPANGAPLATLARHLLATRTSMAVLENRVNRAMYRADRHTPEAVRDAAEAILRESIDADRGAAREAAAAIREAGSRTLTLSRSGTVVDALERGAEDVVVCESRPAREGIAVAEALSEDCAVTLCIDAAAAHELRDVDAVLVGADAVLPDGSVVNKVGTRTVGAAAAREGVPVFVACARDKIRATDRVELEPGPTSEVYDGNADIEVDNPTFDVTPASLVTVVTENGPLDTADVRDLAADHRTLQAWDDD